MSWTTTDIPGLSGKVVVVTGANGGLEFQSAALAGTGAHVIMTARNQTKAAAARDEIVAACSNKSAGARILTVRDQHNDARSHIREV